MIRSLLAILLVTCSTYAGASEVSTTYEHLVLSKAPINRSDIESIKRGAKFFANTCMSCHTMKYLRYDKLAQEAGITYDKMPLNVKTWPNGIIPPDLSLEADIRGVDWIYTYLHAFYQDSTRPTGVNNLLVPNSGMSGILVPYQGEQTLKTGDIATGSVYSHNLEWYDILTLTKQGSMTPNQFDETTADLVNFLAYAAEPYRAEQRQIGWWVLGFLIVLFPFTWLLKKEYWKDVKKHRKD